MANESYQFYNVPGGVTRLGSTLPLSAMLAAALAGSPAAGADPSAAPTPSISQPTVATGASKPVGTAITHGGPAQGGTAPGSLSPAEVSHDLIGRNTAVTPSPTDAMKLAAAISGPFGALTLGGGLVANSLGLGSSPLNPAGASLSPADQAKVQAAFDAAIASGYSATQAQAFANDTLGQVRADAQKAVATTAAATGADAAPAGSFGGKAGQTADNSGQTQTGGVSVTGTGASAPGVSSTSGVSSPHVSIGGLSGPSLGDGSTAGNGGSNAGNNGGGANTGGAGAEGAGSNPGGPPGPR